MLIACQTHGHRAARVADAHGEEADEGVYERTHAWEPLADYVNPAQMYSNLVQNCFDHCVNGFESKSLTSREESCVMRCVDKHMKGSQRLGDRFQEQNAAMAQQGGMPGR
jgi:import inner membrane translocase subunit TIM9